MSETVADHLLSRLAREWNVKRIYGYPGDGINGIMGAFGRSGDCPELVQVRHEEMADLTTLLKDVAHEYVQMATEPGQVRHLIDRAMRTALSERTVTCVILPNDLQMEPAVPTPPHAHGTVHSAPRYSPPRRCSACSGSRVRRSWSPRAAGAITLPAAQFIPFGYWFIVLATITLFGTVCAAFENLSLFAVLAALTAGSACAAVYFLTGTHGWETAGGWVLQVFAWLAAYTGFAMMLEGSAGRVILPLGALKKDANIPGHHEHVPLQFASGEPVVRHGQ